MQKAGEPEIDAGFPKHNYSQLNCSCYSYTSKPIYIKMLHVLGEQTGMKLSCIKPHQKSEVYL